MVKLLFAVCALTACGYSDHFDDCTVSCDDSAGCPDGLMCGAEGLCRAAAATCDLSHDATSDTPTRFASCAGLPATCGTTGTEDCCASPIVPSGTFDRSRDAATDGMHSGRSYPATVSAFALDKYEVTVGRYRKFVDAGAGTRARPPAAGDGAHASIPGSGWDSAWNASLPLNTTALVQDLSCGSSYQTWSATASSNEDLPISCVTWVEAFAFCAWDGGFLPSEAEWNYAAAGGSEQRAYPWSVPASSLAIDCSYANFADGALCVGNPSLVGSTSPKGDARWGQADMGGNLAEWTLDAAGAYSNPCDDCARIPTLGANHEDRGGDYQTIAKSVRTAFRYDVASNFRGSIGLRCARVP